MPGTLPVPHCLRTVLVTVALLSCQRPHVHGSGCEAGIVATPGGPAPALRPPAQQEPPDEPAAELTAAQAGAAFDEAWQTVHDSHFDTSFNGVDWQAVKDELRPRAEEARTRSALREVIGEMLGRLGQSHFAVIPADVLPEEGAAAHDLSGGLGFDVRLRDGKLLVASIEAGGAAAEAGVRPGWIVERIGGFDVGRTVARMGGALEPRKLAFTLWSTALGQILGAQGGRETLAFLDADDHPRELVLERRKRDVTAHEVGPTLPTFYLAFHAELLERGEKRIGLIAFSNWFLPVMKPIDAAVESMRSADGIVIDLRGNTGGAAAMTMGISGHFFAESKKLGVMLTRESTVNILALPRRVNAAGELVEPYAGPVAILVDETTGSASEVFAGGMQSLGRARIFGETTAGAVLPAVATRLPNGDTLLHALGDFETSSGVRLEGAGVVPDEPVPLERAGLLAGRDAPLEAALAWISAKSH